MASEGRTTLSVLNRLFSTSVFFFFLSLNNFHSSYFTYLADGEVPRFFSARLGTFQLYICAEEKSLFSMMLLLHQRIVQITNGYSPWAKRKMKS